MLKKMTLACLTLVTTGATVPAYGYEVARVETDTAAELLLYYDWEELLVETPTRRPTPLRKVAENISVITAEEIRAMNAHSVQEALRTITGVNIDFFGNYFGGWGTFQIHDSHYEHVLVLFDGVRMNEVGSDYNAITGIPVEIIDRIEVVKGPASSVWGSSFGGVINIVTKSPGSGTGHGTLYGSYGDGATQDLRAAVTGGEERFGYYLYGGVMDSDGLGDSKSFRNESGYAKLTGQPSDRLRLTLTGAYWQPEMKSFEEPPDGRVNIPTSEVNLFTSKVEAELSRDFSFTLDLHYSTLEWWNRNNSYATGALLYSDLNENWQYGGNAALLWETGNHALLVGAEYTYARHRYSMQFGATTPFTANPVGEPARRKDWALYANDTISLGKWTVTPGLRYDQLGLDDVRTEYLLSPSLGLVYSLSDKTLLRGTVSHGFIRQNLTDVVGLLDLDPGNPDLKPERVWSYQAGIETDYFANCHLRADFFYHRTYDDWEYVRVNNLYVKHNGGVAERRGFELNGSFRLRPDLTADLGLTHVRGAESGASGVGTGNSLTFNTKLRYTSKQFGSLTLFGQFMELNDKNYPYSNFDNMIWELHYNRDILNTKTLTANLFVSVRNLFNGDSTWLDSYGGHDDVMLNPERWVEAGLRVSF